jgi:hypothetical protein
MAEEVKKEAVETEEDSQVKGSETVEKEDQTVESGKYTDKESEKKSEKTFTQEQVNKMMTKEKNQGRNAAFNELGIDPKDTKMVKMFQAFVNSQKSDEQKESEKKSEEESRIAEAEQRALVAEAKAEAMQIGVKSQFVDDIVTLALSKKTDDSDFKTLIGEFKQKYPTWFGEDEKEDKGKSVGKKGTGSSVKTASKDDGKTENKGLGARLAAQRKGTAGKSSYWKNN